MTEMVILVSTAYYHSCHTDVLSTNVAVLTSITIPVIQMFCINGNTSEYCFISGQKIGTTGMVILVSTASLVDRTSVQQEW
jgi:hypothetical protein